MKFYCDNCQTKYSIADEKVRGKVLKVRCKKCSHVITVREPDAPSGAGSSRSRASSTNARNRQGASTSSPDRSTPQLEWHYSVNGQSFGPLSERELASKFASGELGDATYVWNETFSDWKPARSVADFATALNKAQDVRPSKNTMGVDEAMEAVDADKERSDVASRRSEGTSDAADPGQPTSEQEDRQSAAAQPKPEQEKRESAAAQPTSEQKERESSAAKPTSEQEKRESSAAQRQSREPSKPRKEQQATGPKPSIDAPDSGGESPRREDRTPDEKPGTGTPEDRGGAQKNRLDSLRQRLGVSPSKDDAVERDESADAVGVDDVDDADERRIEDDSDAGSAEPSPAESGDGPEADVTPESDDDEVGGVEALRRQIAESEPEEPSSSPDRSIEQAESPETEEAGPVSPQLDDPEEQEPSRSMDDAARRPDNDEHAQPQVGPDSQQDDDADVGFASTLPDTSQPVSDGSDDDRQMVDDAVHDGLFSGMDDGEAESAPAPSPEAKQPAQSADASDGDDADDPDDAVPFFPSSSAPKLGESDDESDESTSMSRVGEITDSLLIQIDDIKSDGRKRAIFGTIGLLAALATVGAVAYFAWMDMGTDEVIDDDDGVQMGNVGQAPEFHTYSEEELAQVSDRFVVEDEVVISREDSRAAYDREQASEGGGRAATDRPSGDESAAMAGPEPDSFQAFDGGDEGQGAADREEAEAGVTGSRFGRPEVGGGSSSSDSGMAEMDDGSDESGGSDGGGDDRFEAMAAIQSDRDRQVFDGDENVDLESMELQEGLTGEQISNGISTVMESIGSCRERHIFRGGSFDADQIQVSLTVLPDGDIGQFEMEPSSLDDTDFKRCMDSHTGRWRFPRFLGDPVQLQVPFALQ